MPAHRAVKLDREGKTKRKNNFVNKIHKFLEEYEKLMIVRVDNIGSHHLQNIRKEIRGMAELVLGKNTMIKKAIKGYAEKHPEYHDLLPHFVGNVGILFTHEDLSVVRDKLNTLRQPSAARLGFIAPCDVIVPAGDTGMDPSQTSFLHALNIVSKINKGKIEILNDVHLIKKGDKVGANEAVLLQKLDMKPFVYGIEIETIYENHMVLDAAVLDVTEEEAMKVLVEGIKNVTALADAANVPTVANVPYMIMSGIQNLIGLGLEADIKSDLLDKVKESIESASAAPVPAAAAPVEVKEEKKEEKKEEAKEEEESEGEEGFMDLFG